MQCYLTDFLLANIKPKKGEAPMILRKTINLAELATLDLYSVVGLAVNVNGKIEIITADLERKIDQNEFFDISRPLQYKNAICIKELHSKGGFSAVVIEGNMLMVPVAQEAINIMLRNMQRTNMVGAYFPGLSIFQNTMIYKKTIESKFLLQKDIEMIRINGEELIHSTSFDNNRVFRTISLQKAINLNDWSKSSKVLLSLQKDVTKIGRISGKNNPIMPITFSDGSIVNYHFAIKSMKDSVVDIPHRMVAGKKDPAYLGRFSLSAKAQQINKTINIFIDNAKFCFAEEYSPAMSLASVV